MSKGISDILLWASHVHALKHPHIYNNKKNNHNTHTQHSLMFNCFVLKSSKCSFSSEMVCEVHPQGDRASSLKRNLNVKA